MKRLSKPTCLPRCTWRTKNVHYVIRFYNDEFLHIYIYINIRMKKRVHCKVHERSSLCFYEWKRYLYNTGNNKLIDKVDLNHGTQIQLIWTENIYMYPSLSQMNIDWQASLRFFFVLVLTLCSYVRYLSLNYANFQNFHMLEIRKNYIEQPTIYRF